MEKAVIFFIPPAVQTPQTVLARFNCSWCRPSLTPSPLWSSWQLFNTVLRIHDILVWIRIRIWIRGSMPLTNGSGSGFGSASCFCYWPSRRQQKTNLKKKFFCLLLFEGTFTSFFKDKKSKRSHKAVGFFLQFLLGDIRIRIRSRIHTSDHWIRI